MSLSFQNNEDSLHKEVTPESKQVWDFGSKTSGTSHSKNKKSSVKEFQVKDLLINSRLLDNVQQFNAENTFGKDSPRPFQQILLSRISRRPSEDVQNKSTNQCFELIVREYQFAFDRIEVALQQKEAQVTRMKREYQVQIQEKELLIEELRGAYELELKGQDDNLRELNSTNSNLEQKLKEYTIQMEILKAQNQLLAETLSQHQESFSHKEESANQATQKLQKLLSETTSTIAEKNQIIDDLKKLHRNDRQNSQHLLGSCSNQGSSVEDNSAKARLEIDQLKHVVQQLHTNMALCSEQNKQLRQYKVSYVQTKGLLQQSLRVCNSMRQEVQSLNSQLRLFKEGESLLQSQLVESRQSVRRFQFQNQTLNSYNQAILVHANQQPKKNKFAVSRFHKENTQTLSTKFFS